MKVDIYIKLSTHGNPRGSGKAAAIIEFIRRGSPEIRDEEDSVSFGTKNRLALAICNKAMKKLIKPCSVTIHIDNRHIKYAMENGWVKRWGENGWVKPNGNPPANIGEWKLLLIFSEMHKITWEPYSPKYENELNRIIEDMEEPSGEM